MDEFIIPSYLTYPEDQECQQWYFIEGKERINELSRQVQTFLQYKKKVVRLICSDSIISLDFLQTNSIQKKEERFLSILSQYISLIKKTGVRNKRIKQKIFQLKLKAISQPNCPEVILLKNIAKKGKELWNILHILSDMDKQTDNQVLKSAIEILVHLCDAESELNSIFAEFYQELRLNYQLLEQEYENLYIKMKNTKDDAAKYKKRVMIPE